MQIDRITLENFRNYSSFSQAFSPGVNLILGENAQGKTNLLEAIYALSTGHGFRTRKEAELVRFGQDFADLQAQVTGQTRQQTIRVVFFAGRRSKQLYLNGVRRKLQGELAGVLTTVLFCPEDLAMLKAGAAGRRRFLDNGLCQLRPGYASALQTYNRILEQKSRILRDRFQNPNLLAVLPEYSQQLCQVGAVLIAYRARYLDSLGKAATEYHRAFSGGRETLEIPYRTVSTVDNPMAPTAQIAQQLLDHWQSHRGAELESAQCLTGPHRDDFDAVLDGLSLKHFGSQGQTRTAAISLKLAQRQVMGRDTGEEPVLLLDDVLSELDPGRQDFVLNQIQSGQVFITCCEPGRLTKAGQTIRIAAGKLE